MDAKQFMSVAGYFRHSRATFTTDPYNVLAYTSDEGEPFFSGPPGPVGFCRGRPTGLHARAQSPALDQGRVPIGPDDVEEIKPACLRLLVRKRKKLAPRREVKRNVMLLSRRGGVLSLNADRRIIGYREEFWFQDQFTPNEQWTVNLGLRVDNIHGYVEAFQISPRIGVTYTPNDRHAFHAFYGRLFTPPNLESLAF